MKGVQGVHRLLHIKNGILLGGNSTGRDASWAETLGGDHARGRGIVTALSLPAPAYPDGRHLGHSIPGGLSSLPPAPAKPTPCSRAAFCQTADFHLPKPGPRDISQPYLRRFKSFFFFFFSLLRISSSPLECGPFLFDSFGKGQILPLPRVHFPTV